ncbi:MAG: ANTAR domain-containing protein [Mycobacteriaceae bacterium]|nr:ANTAR domain-containing protein [Mycobacteriaceae bacterium]
MHPVGTFRFWYADQRWEWSDELARLHGYRPGQVVPTTELLLSHKHPDDRAQVADTIAHVIEAREPFSSRHRFLDTAGAVHDVLVVADHLFDDDGGVVGATGDYIELMRTQPDRAELDHPELDESQAQWVSSRAVIEQAKGVLMRVYRISADQAFDVLRWRSQETNTKLRDLAAQLLAELDTVPAAPVSIQTRFDHLLLTVHERVPKPAAGLD